MAMFRTLGTMAADQLCRYRGIVRISGMGRGVAEVGTDTATSRTWGISVSEGVFQRDP